MKTTFKTKIKALLKKVKANKAKKKQSRQIIIWYYRVIS